MSKMNQLKINIHITIETTGPVNVFIDREKLIESFEVSACTFQDRGVTVFCNQFGISEREYEVLNGLRLGMTNQEIAEKLFLSVSTVKYHINRIFEKMSVKNRVQAINKVNTHLV